MNLHGKRMVWFLAASVSMPCFAEDDFGSEYSFLKETVFTPALMEQSIANTPGAVTIITANQIKMLGIRSIPEALRLVPGFNVDYSSPFTYVNRGPNFPTPRRIQVLVDGVSEVNALVGLVRWETIPVPIDRVARIEVVRSQSSAAYGANAFFGTVNIISKHPEDYLGSEINVAGSDRTGFSYAKQGSQFGNTTVLVDYKKQQQDRFDTFYKSEEDRADDMDVDTLGVTSLTRLEDGSSLKFSLSGARGAFEHEVSAGEYGVTYPQPELDTVLGVIEYQKNFNDHSLKFSAYLYDRDWDFDWDICGPKLFFYPGLGELYRDNPALVLAALNGASLPQATPEQLEALSSIVTGIFSDPTSFNEVCGTADTSYRTRTQIATITDVWSILPQLRVSTSLQMEYRNIESYTFGNGKTAVEKSKIFSNAEYDLSNYLTFNIGFMAESLGYDLPEPEISPRFGVHIHFNDSNTLKLIYSEGKRLIDGIEVIDYNQTRVYLDTPVYGASISSPFIGYFPVIEDKNFVEEIRSRELIYYNHTKWSELELRAFEEDLNNIYNYQDASGAPITSYVRQGGELTLTLPTSWVDIRFSGHYITSESETGVAYDDYDAYGGSAYLIKHISNSVYASIGYYGSSAIYFSSYDRTDVRIAKEYVFSDAILTIGGMVSHHRSDYKRAIDYGGELDGGEVIRQNEISLDIGVSF